MSKIDITAYAQKIYFNANRCEELSLGSMFNFVEYSFIDDEEEEETDELSDVEIDVNVFEEVSERLDKEQQKNAKNVIMNIKKDNRDTVVLRYISSAPGWFWVF